MIKQLKYFLIISITLFTSSCNGQIQTKSQIDKESDKHNAEKLANEKVEPFKYGAGDVVNRGYLDKSGNIWFGGRYGILWRYDGEVLKDFTPLKRG